MQNYSKIYNRIWQNQGFKLMSDSAKMLYLYLLSSPHGNLLGTYFLPFGYIASDLNWGKYKVQSNIIELVSNGFISWCENTKMIRIHRYIKFQPLSNPNVVLSSLRILESIPSPSIDLLKELMQDVEIEIKNDKSHYTQLLLGIQSIIENSKIKSQSFIYVDRNDKNPFKNIMENTPLLTDEGDNQGKGHFQTSEESKKEYAKNSSEQSNDEITNEQPSKIKNTILEKLKNKIHAEKITKNEEIENKNEEIENKEKFSKIIDIPLIDDTLFSVNSSYLKELQEVYTNVDVLNEFKKMQYWCKNNPGKRKTKKFISKFINNWLSNASLRSSQKSANLSDYKHFASNEVLEIFEYWKNVMDIQEAVLNAQRLELIKKTLTIYKVDSIKSAILGCSMSSFHQGVNKDSIKYNDLSNILQDPRNIEKFIQKSKDVNNDDAFIINGN